MAILKKAQSVQATVNNQSDVAETLANLINTEGIDLGQIITVDVEEFGTNQFLIVVLYYGSYVQRVATGLSTALSFLAGVARAFSPSLGLVLSQSRFASYARGLSPTVGLTPTLSLDVVHYFKPSIGLVCDVSYEHYSP